MTTTDETATAAYKLALDATADPAPADAARDAYQRAASDARRTGRPIAAILRDRETAADAISRTTSAAFYAAEAAAEAAPSDTTRAERDRREQTAAYAWLHYEAEHYARLAADAETADARTTRGA